MAPSADDDDITIGEDAANFCASFALAVEAFNWVGLQQPDPAGNTLMATDALLQHAKGYDFKTT